MNCICRIVDVMQKIPTFHIKNEESQQNYKNLFENCLSAVQISFNLINQKSRDEIMNSNKNQPLKPALRRLIEKN